MENKYIPNVAIPPGDTIQDMIDDLGMTQKELATRLDVTPKHVNKLVKGTASLTHDMALKLESVLGLPASFWINLEANYQENLARIQALPELEEESEYLKFLPYREMEKSDWVPKASNKIDKIRNLRKFFRVASLDCLPTVEATAFRKSTIHQGNEYALVAWLTQCEYQVQSGELYVHPFSAEKVKESIPKLRRLTTRPLKASWTELQQICAQCGIACVCVQPIEKTHVNGATKWISDSRVMVAMTTRGGYEDIFWFTFFHEIGHVLESDKSRLFIDTDCEATDLLEDRADEFASECLVPTAKYLEFLSQTTTYEPKEIRRFAESLGVHTGIVVGKLMKDGRIEFSDYRYHDFRRKCTL